jgi:hypothetical protein
MIRLAAAFWVLLIMSSCDPIYSYKYEVNNQTTHRIRVRYLENESIFTREFPDSVRQVFLDPNTKKVLYVWSIRGSEGRTLPETAERIQALQRLEVRLADSLDATSDMLQTRRWLFREDPLATLNGYLLEITEDDFR